MDIRMTVKEAAKITGKGELFIRHAIKNGSFPGAYSLNENGHADFLIPRLAFYKFLGYSDSDAKKMALLEQDQNRN